VHVVATNTSKKKIYFFGLLNIGIAIVSSYGNARENYHTHTHTSEMAFALKQWRRSPRRRTTNAYAPRLCDTQMTWKRLIDFNDDWCNDSAGGQRFVEGINLKRGDLEGGNLPLKPTLSVRIYDTKYMLGNKKNDNTNDDKGSWGAGMFFALAESADSREKYVVVRHYIATRKIDDIVASELPRASVALLFQSHRVAVCAAAPQLARWYCDLATPTGSAGGPESFLRSFTSVPGVPVAPRWLRHLLTDDGGAIESRDGDHLQLCQAARWALALDFIAKQSAVFDDCADFLHVHVSARQDQTWARVFHVPLPFDVKRYIKSFVARSVDEFRPHVGSDEAWFECTAWWLLRGARSPYTHGILRGHFRYLEYVSVVHSALVRLPSPTSVLDKMALLLVSPPDDTVDDDVNDDDDDEWVVQAFTHLFACNTLESFRLRVHLDHCANSVTSPTSGREELLFRLNDAQWWQDAAPHQQRRDRDYSVPDYDVSEFRSMVTHRPLYAHRLKVMSVDDFMLIQGGDRGSNLPESGEGDLGQKRRKVAGGNAASARTSSALAWYNKGVVGGVSGGVTSTHRSAPVE